jgi:putative toxin-antitoxin system antitoxin component (TIGR02293 family)
MKAVSYAVSVASSFLTIRDWRATSGPGVGLFAPDYILAKDKHSRRARRLLSEESDRLYRVARVLARTEQVFGDQEKAARWLRRPHPVLNRQVPLEMLDTDIGARQVETILGRIEHGVYS